jgi:hypothetical protein
MHKIEICPNAFLLLPWFDTFIAKLKILNLEIDQPKY